MADEDPPSSSDEFRSGDGATEREGVRSGARGDETGTSETARHGAPPGDAAERSERIATALHDISNSLTAVLGLLQRALPSTQGEAREALTHAIERARQAHRVARAAIGRGVDATAQPPRAFGEVVEETVLGLLPHASECGVTIEHQLFPELRSVGAVDPDALSRVLTNLLLNAVQHSEIGGRVRLVGDVGRPGQALISITDQGPGVPVALRERLFKERVTTRADGAGIGLHSSAELSVRVGGGLRLVPSQTGAHFAVTWPISAEPLVSSRASRDGGSPHGSMPPSSGAVRYASTLHPPSSGTLQSMRLLLVEDDPAIAEMLKAALSARGATLRVVSRRRDLDAALEESSYQGILLDLSPIADDVVGVLSAVHKKNPDARLLLISGSVEGLPTLSADIFITWVQKPFELEDVVRALVAPISSSKADSA